MGRKNKPTALNKLHDAGKRDIPETEHLDVAADVVPPPDYLTGEAADEWNRLCPLLVKVNILDEKDLNALGAYCRDFELWIKYKDVEPTIKVGKDKSVVMNPLLGIANAAQVRWMKTGTEFGLTPSSRVKLGIVPKKEGGKNDHYFKSKNPRPSETKH